MIMRQFLSSVALASAGIFVAAGVAAEPFVYAIDALSGEVHVIDSATDTLVDTIVLPPPEPGGYPDQGSPTTPNPAAAVVSKDGRHLIMTQHNRRDIYLVNLDNGNIRIRRAHTAADVSLSPDGSTAYLSSLNGFVSIVRQKEPVRRFSVESARQTITSPDGMLAYTRGGGPGSSFVQVTDLATLSPVATVPTCGSGINNDMAMTPDGRFLYVVCFFDDTVEVIDLQTYMVVDTLSGFDEPSDIEIHPSGTEAYVLNGAPRRVAVISLSDNTYRRGIVVTHGLGDMAMTPDGSKLYVSHPFAGEVEVLSTLLRVSLGTISTGPYPGIVVPGPSGSPF
jgi:DNA-binding beta-propeller fold protein YncE